MIDEYDAIARVVQLFLDGSDSGDEGKMREAFHPSARLIGTGDQVYDMSRDEFVAQYRKTPMNIDGRYRGRLVSVQIYGKDTAVAIVAEDHCWGTEAFLDVLSMWKQAGEPWRIVNKVFTHSSAKA